MSEETYEQRYGHTPLNRPNGPSPWDQPCWNCDERLATYPERWCFVCIWRHDFGRAWWHIGWRAAKGPTMEGMNPPCSQRPGFCTMSDYHSQPWIGSTSYCRDWQPAWWITKPEQLPKEGDPVPDNMVVR